ncbi:zinc finger protein 704 [Paramormyrops kingsleyae]|uniref:SLC2A4 regulator n=1 Tax=Paramormyrops kingsleyae TaxID=1676925 RepID=A0A3B3RPN1_9TELE|nr:zinc finger protein 704-like [Paramormyrops kingsleyae]
MTSKRLLHRSLVGMRVGTATGQAGSGSHAADGKPYGKTGAPVDCGIMLACKSDHSSGSFLYTLMLDDGTLRDPREDVLLNGIDLTAPGKEKFIFDPKITARNSDVDHRIEADLIVVQKRSPTHRLVLNGKKLDDQMHTEGRGPGRRGEEPRKDPQTPPADTPPEDLDPLASSHIPVPRNRKAAGHADKEVMAAAVLTSLSSSPMVLNTTPGTPAAVPEPASRGWKECLSASYSSSTSGNWSWDASDQSVPSTPSPPLSNDVSKGFLLPSQGEDNTEESETTHFLFEDPIPRKRKNSMKVMFKCLWKNCEKVLSTSSGIQRHIRTVHLGRNGDSDYSDGEEDFYYSEIEVNMDTLSEGLSNLTPTSPTTATAPPVFPVPELPHSEPAHIALRCPPCPTPLSQSAPSTLCHIRTDHAYQGPAGPIRPMGVGEKRHSVQHATVTKSHPPAIAAPKPSAGSRKPRGEAKKCRKVYGMEKKDMWCTACRWKKACQRFTD